jgi:Fe-S cluster assembly scaffold protein SufB
MVRLFIFRKILFVLRSINILRINDPKSGQFERTASTVNYLEGCTAPQYDTNQPRCRCRANCIRKCDYKYSTVQNWYSGNEFGKGGVYNFVTKRDCAGSNSKISWTQVGDQLLLEIPKLFTCR